MPLERLSDEQKKKEQLQNLLELGKHQRAVDTFWDRVMTRHKNHELPKQFFKKGGGWIERANNYRLLSEPLYIANHYRSGFDKDGIYMLQDEKGRWVNRPARYTYYEGMWRDLRGTDPVPATAWADEYERQLQNSMGEGYNERGHSRLEAPIRTIIDLSNIDPNGWLAAASPGGSENAA